MVADGLDLKLDTIIEHSKVELAQQDIKTASGTLQKGAMQSLEVILIGLRQ